MKICPACKNQYDDSAIICPECYTRQPLLEKKGYYQFTIDFFNHSLNLFTIIGLIVTILTLFPLFVTFILGENWFNLLLADPTVGFQSLLLILIATFFGAAFVYYILALIIIDFLNQIRREPPLHKTEILFALSILSIVIIAIGSLISFLWLVWFNKYDLIVFFYGVNLLLLSMIPAFIIIISGIIQIFTGSINDPIFSDFKNSIISCSTEIKNCIINSKISTDISSCTKWLFSKIYSGRKLLMIICLLILIVASLYFVYLLIFNWIIPIYQNISTLNTETTKYYSSKEVVGTIHYDILNQSNITPIVLSVQRYIDTNSTKNWSGFDDRYVQCHWSTNFGYFYTTSLDYSMITTHTQTLIVPSCVNNKDLVFWTYDLTDYYKSKPNVSIGFTLEDQNKILKTEGNGVLGKANLSFSWSNVDTVSNVSLNYSNIS